MLRTDIRSGHETIYALPMPRSDWQELTERERAVLAAVERRLGNGEIAREFHISVRTVESHIAALRRKLNAGSRSELIEAARGQRRVTVSLPRNSFIGRRDDLAAVASLLRTNRWVTIVGSAGAGKTRLAMEVAAADNRVPVVVDLEHATPSDVSVSLGRALGLASPDRIEEMVASCGLVLAADAHLLLLDNCDRVTASVIELIDRLFRAAPSLVLLATCRGPIGGSDEALLDIKPLSIRDTGPDSAAALFRDRAVLTSPKLILSAEDEECIAAICRRLDGLPLAIELAAARVRHLSLPELKHRLAFGFEALDRAGSTSRHRTLEAAFEWTWDLLEPAERELLAKLAALPGSFDLELADAVAGGTSAGSVLHLLDRSLISPASAGPTGRRFRMLASLREFVLARSSAEPTWRARQAHAIHYATTATTLAARSRTDDSRSAVALSESWYPDLTNALDWALTNSPDLALKLARALAVLIEQHGAKSDCLDVIARAAVDVGIREQADPIALLELGEVICYTDLDLAADLADLALSKIQGPDVDIAFRLAAHHLAGMVQGYRNHGSAAMEYLNAAEELANRTQDWRQLGSVWQAKGIALRRPDLGDPEGAIVAFEIAMQSYAIAGDTMHLNNSRYMMAATAADFDLQTQQARGWAEQCVAYAHATGNHHELAHALLTQAALSDEHDNETNLREAARSFQILGDLRCLTRSYLLLADRKALTERPALLRQALDVARRAHDLVNQEKILKLLVTAHWECGQHRDAGLALGALSNLIGLKSATQCCPAPMLAQLDDWHLAILEGQASSVG